MEQKYLETIAQDTTKHLSIKPEIPELEKLEDLEAWLTGEIDYLLDHNFESLINALYRIDVNEKKVMETLAMRQTELIPNQLAKLVIQRIFEKIKTRERFGS